MEGGRRVYRGWFNGGREGGVGSRSELVRGGKGMMAKGS